MRVALAAVWAVIIAAGIIQTANALQTDLLSLRGGLESFPAASIGVIMAGYYVGYTLGPIVSPRVIRALGHVTTVGLALGAAALIIILHGLIVTPIIWTLLRALDGIALSSTYVALESWINERAENRVRGRVFSLYMVMQMTGMTAAQALLTLGNPKTMALFVLSAAIFVAGAIPVLAARSSAPHHAPPQPFGLPGLFRASPLGAITTVLAGVSWSVFFTFGPLYAQREGFDVSGVALFMGAAMATGAVLQFPLGWLSDHVGRRSTIGLLCVAATLAALFAIGVESASATLKIVASALAGGLIFPLYSLSVAQTNDAIQPQLRVAAAAGLVLLFGLGSIAGPLITGWAVTLFGSLGFYTTLAAVTAASVAATVVTR
jgi:MFS family permease